MKKISIIVVSYNSVKDIYGCLSSIYKNNDIGEELEVIVVDNKSDDIVILKNILLDEFPQVLLIENTKNGGYGQGNNVGIRHSSAPIIMIMNPDVRLFKPIFNHVLQHYENNPKLSMLGICQYESIEKKGNSFLPLEHYLFSLVRYIYYKKTDTFNPNYLMISGACFFIRKSHFEKIGLFDENIFMYGEEYDINIRLREAGYTIIFDNSIGYIHPVHERVGSMKSEEIGYQSFLYTRRKYGKNIRKELIHTIIYFYLMRIRSGFGKNVKLVSFYDNCIRFYKEKLKIIKTEAMQ